MNFALPEDFHPFTFSTGDKSSAFLGKKKKSEKLLDCKISTGSDLLALFLFLIPLPYLSLCPLPSPFNRREPQYGHLSVSCGHSASPVLPLLPFHPKRPPAAQTPLFSLPNPAWGARAPLRSAAWAPRAPLLPSGARRNRLRFSHRPPKNPHLPLKSTRTWLFGVPQLLLSHPSVELGGKSLGGVLVAVLGPTSSGFGK